MGIIEDLLHAVFSPRDDKEIVIKKLRKKVHYYKQRLAVFEDIALGIRNKDLLKIYKKTSKVKDIIEQQTVKRNIFI
jgi:hypothetical protein